MIAISHTLFIDERDVSFLATTASGPGGQHVNKTASAVQLRFDLGANTTLPPGVKSRLSVLAAGRISSEGLLLINAQRFRSQEQNRQDAFERLFELIRQASHPPRPRRPTKPTRSSREKRIEQKKRHGEQKRLRQLPP
jgi:ribosome-associated protein